MKRQTTAVGVIGLLAGLLAGVGSAHGQTPAIGPRPTQFPDVIVSDVGSGNTDLLYYGTKNGISGYSLGSVSCNIATNASWVAIWIDSQTGTYGNQHPVIGGQIYRLFNNRFEQIGLSWLKHGFCAADFPQCANLAEPGTTVPISNNGSCDWLGTGQTDTYSAGLNGNQSSLGPRSEINSWTGQFPYPYQLGWTGSQDCIGKRLQVRKTDFTPALYPGAQYFGEVVYVCTDEWEGQRLNNYSYRKIQLGALQSSPTGQGNTCNQETGYNLSFNGATIPKQAAIEAWKTADPSVKLVYAAAPNDGRFAVASKVVDQQNGTWRYEYAVMNLNSHRGAGSFSIAKAPTGMTVSEQGFYAPTYHSGEPYAATPWTMSAEGSQIAWSTEAYTANNNANALRWSTLYNFRFVTNQPPTSGSVSIGLFRPAVAPGDPDTVTIAGLDVPTVPTPPGCPADFNGVGGVSVQDVFDYLAAWFAGSPSADFNGVAGVTVQDIFDFLNAWFTPCP